MSVAIADGMIAVGADSYPVASTTTRDGSVSLFTEPANGTWVSTSTPSEVLQASDVANNANQTYGGQFGEAVAAETGTVVVGAPDRAIPNNNEAGEAYVFGTPTIPVIASAPVISGTAQPGQKVACSTGTWTSQPTSFTYQWSRSGTPIQGATANTYTVRTSDEQLTLTCTVTASNITGSGKPVTTGGVQIPVPKVVKCPAATGTLTGRQLGQVKLGMTRVAARHAYARSSDRRRKYEDVFCLTPTGVRVGYGSPAVPRTLRGRVIWALTSSAYYTFHSIRVGATIAAADKLVKLTGPIKVNGAAWYLARNGASNAVFHVRGGIIQEIGIANKPLTTGKTAELSFLKTLG